VEPPPSSPSVTLNPQFEVLQAQKDMLAAAHKMVEEFRTEAQEYREERARDAAAEKSQDDDYERQEYNGCLRIFAAEALSGLVEDDLPPHKATERAFEYAQAMYQGYTALKRPKPSLE